jgi:hypothetical protein
MADQEKKLAIAARRKSHRFGNRAGQSGQKSTYKSKVIKLEEDTFDVGASSDPAKFSKSLKSIKNYIQKTCKMPDDIVRAIQQMKRPSLPYPDKPKKALCVDDQGDLDEDEFEMVKFTWEERLQGYEGEERQKQRERIKCMGAYYLRSVRTQAEEQVRGDGQLQRVQE